MVERNGLEATGIPSTGTALKNWTRDFDHQARVFDLHVCIRKSFQVSDTKD